MLNHHRDLHEYIKNTQTELYQYQDMNIVINNAYRANECYLFSPINFYVVYPKKFFQSLKSFLIRSKLNSLSKLLEYYLRYVNFDQTLFLDHDLATIPYHPPRSEDQLRKLLAMLKQYYPQHAYFIFGLNEMMDKNLMQTIANCDFKIFPGKPVHFFDNHQSNFLKRNHIKRDLKLLATTTVTKLKKDDYHLGSTLQKLYHQLYITKHSLHNMDYTVKFFEDAIRHERFDFYAISHQTDQIAAFTSFRTYNNFMLCGPIGYDISLDKEHALYRKLSVVALDHCARNQLIFNYGSGADDFKKKRGSIRSIEYNAVYYQHLPLKKQSAWRLINYLLNKFGTKMFDLDAF